MYNISNLYNYEKDPSIKYSRHNIHSLTNKGLDEYTNKDSYFVHKYITGRRLDMLDACSPNKHVKNHNHCNHNKEQVYHSNTEENIKIKEDIQPYQETVPCEKNKIYKVSKRLYKTPEKIQPIIQKSSPKLNKNEIFSYNNVPKNQNIKSFSSNIINLQNQRLLRCIPEANAFDQENLKIKEIASKQMNDQYCINNKLPTISSIVHTGHSIINVKGVGKFMGLKYDPSNYVNPQFNKKR